MAENTSPASRSEPTFAPVSQDDGQPKGRGNEQPMQGRKGGEASGGAGGGSETPAQRIADDPSQAPEEDNRSTDRSLPGGQV